MRTPASERITHFERRPALIVLIAAAMGIAWAHRSGSPKTLFIVALILLLGAVCLGYVLRKKPLALVLSTLAASFAFGVLVITTSLVRERSSVLGREAEFGHEELALSGEVEDVRSGGYLYVKLRCDSVVSDDRVYRSDGEAAGVFFYVYDTSRPPSLAPGMRVRVFGDLAALGPQRNPYAFDYDEYLRTNEGIDAVLYCDSYDDIMVTGHARPTLYDRTLSFFAGLRQASVDGITDIVSDTLVRGFILAMVVGERSALPDSVWKDFQAAGLSHILVVSGFNLGLIAWVLYTLLRLVRVGRREVRIGLVMLATLCYGALIGPQASVVRAVIVVELVLVSRLLERKSDLANVTAGAALVDLLFHPADLFNVSFQLSYGAVLSLTMIAPALDKFIFNERKEGVKHWYDRFVKIAIGTGSVLLGTLPIVLFHFHQVSVISILTNLLTIPLASLATILGVLLVPLAALAPGLASLYADAIAMTVYTMGAIASVARNVPLAVIKVPHPPTVFLVFYTLGLLHIMRARNRGVALARAGGAAVVMMSV